MHFEKREKIQTYESKDYTGGCQGLGMVEKVGRCWSKVGRCWSREVGSGDLLCSAVTVVNNNYRYLCEVMMYYLGWSW